MIGFFTSDNSMFQKYTHLSSEKMQESFSENILEEITSSSIHRFMIRTSLKL